MFSREMSQRQLFERTDWLQTQKKKLELEGARCSNLLNRMLPPNVVKEWLVRPAFARARKLYPLTPASIWRTSADFIAQRL